MRHHGQGAEGACIQLLVQVWERDQDIHIQAGKMCSTYFATSPTSCLAKFTFQILWNQRHCSTLNPQSKEQVLWCLHTFASTHVSNHAPKTKELKLKLCKDTAPSSHSGSSSEGNNRIPRNISCQANSPTASLPLVTSLHFPTRFYTIPTSFYIAWVKAQSHASWRTHSPSNSFIASKATSDTKHTVWFPSPFWELTFTLIWSVKPNLTH